MYVNLKNCFEQFFKEKIVHLESNGSFTIVRSKLFLAKKKMNTLSTHKSSFTCKFQRLPLGFVVTPIKCDESEQITRTAMQNSEDFCNNLGIRGASLSSDLHTFYNGQKNYSDIRFQSNDGVVFNVHKFVVAARSEKFEKIICEETCKPGYGGVVRFANLDGATLKAVLYWMYTGEVKSESCEDIEAMLNCALRFELKGLLEIVETQIKQRCTKENMFQLYEIAKANGLDDAKEDISAFLKE